SSKTLLVVFVRSSWLNMGNSGMTTITPDNQSEDQQPEAVLLYALGRIAEALERLADHFAPSPPDIVGTSYVAQRLGCTQVWITTLIREGDGPRSCVVPAQGTARCGSSTVTRSTSGSGRGEGRIP